MSNLSTVVVIPARGGSKGLPRKNLRTLGGVPLIAWSIAAAKQAPSVTDVIVSTEDEEIAEVAKAWGAEVPFFRPREMAGDQSAVSDAIQYTVKNLAESYDVELTLFPTHPFRTPELIEQAIEITKTSALSTNLVVCERNVQGDFIFADTANSRFVVSAPGGALVRKIGLLSAASRFPRSVYQSQGIEHYCALAAAIRGGDTRFLIPEHFQFIDDPVLLTDIDTERDLRHAEELVATEQISWTPDHGCRKATRLPHASPPKNCIHCTVQNLVSGSSAEVEMAVNPSWLTPYELREIIDRMPDFQHQEVLVSLENFRASSTEKFYSQNKPHIVAHITSPLKLGSGIVRPMTAFSYLFASAELAQEAGAYAGDIASSFSQGHLCVDLMPFQTVGTTLLARATDANIRVIGESSLYRFDGRAWQIQPSLRRRDRDANIFLRQHSSECVLDVPANTLAVELAIFSEQSQNPIRNYFWDAIEFNGLLEYDAVAGGWWNCETETYVTGRQQLPSVHRWIGCMYLPKVVTQEQRWEINLQS